MTPRIDDGDVIAQIEFPIRDLTYSQVYRRIVEETPGLVREVAAFFADPRPAARPQDPAQATFFRNDRDIHRRIFWRLHPAEQIRNLCRTERAFCFFRGRAGHAAGSVGRARQPQPDQRRRRSRAAPWSTWPGTAWW